METLLAGLGWLLGFVGIGLMLNMDDLIEANRAIGIARATRNPDRQEGA